MPCEMSSVGRQDEQERFVSTLTDTVTVQRLVVPRQPFPNHPSLHCGGELKVMADLLVWKKTQTNVSSKFFKGVWQMASYCFRMKIIKVTVMEMPVVRLPCLWVVLLSFQKKPPQSLGCSYLIEHPPHPPIVYGKGTFNRLDPGDSHFSGMFSHTGNNNTLWVLCSCTLNICFPPYDLLRVGLAVDAHRHWDRELTESLAKSDRFLFIPAAEGVTQRHSQLLRCRWKRGNGPLLNGFCVPLWSRCGLSNILTIWRYSHK